MEMIVQSRAFVQELNQFIQEMKVISAHDFLKWTTRVKWYRELIDQQIVESDRRMEMKDKLSVIVCNLQFHDIIEQQLQHIININEKLVGLEMKEASEAFMSKILNIYILLLDYVEDEYLKAGRIIKEKLTSIWKNSGIQREGLLRDEDVFGGTTKFLHKKRLAYELLERNFGPEDSKIDWNREQYKEILNVVKVEFSMYSERKIFNKVFGFPEELPSQDTIDLF